jgi:hypothetical protein
MLGMSAFESEVVFGVGSITGSPILTFKALRKIPGL